ncbi:MULTISPECIES: hypothetical protein [Aeromonas]|uniref:hypothetical protein n=1 Tax=Aeromonas TaxID=642 RepID=UPI0015DCDDBB|nr:hypothetical protein [Aeromonas caviae]MBL0531164.1 hypothetical protein [Aeromonas caviae]MBL0652703.1 hypothetical protein [Aeromonas caviae]WKL90174.1 hypothetical protein Q2F48_07200 [Aeromonas caviae]BBT22125.1 hypothetical protein WP8S17E03_25500 [Aeromonas caviae]
MVSKTKSYSFGKVIKEPARYRLLLLFYFFIVVYITKDAFILNTGDYIRVTFPFIDADINELRELTNSGGLIYKLKLENESILEYFNVYPSFFSFLAYWYAVFIRVFTDYFDIRLFSLVGKFIFCLGFFSLWGIVNRDGSKLNLLFCLLASLVLMIPAYSSMLNSFYQEQVIIYALPWVVVGYLNLFNKGGWITLVCAVTAISLSKSQFFIFPGIVIVSLLLMPIKKNVTKKTVCMLVVAQVFSLLFISMSGESTSLNKYHATYYGVYLGKYLGDDKFDFNSNSNNIDVNCIGVDAWGNRYDSAQGATSSEIGEGCFERNKKISALSLLKFIIEQPEVLTYPLRSAFSEHLKLDYFHVYKKYLLLKGHDVEFIRHIQDFNEKYVSFLKVPISIILMLALLIFGVVKPNVWLAIFWGLSTLTVSQAYISFFGEGYRDLSKHLFPMQYTFDFMLVVLIFTLLSRFKGVNTETFHNKN